MVANPAASGAVHCARLVEINRLAATHQPLWLAS
jgi:hypothetical protein